MEIVFALFLVGITFGGCILFILWTLIDKVWNLSK